MSQRDMQSEKKYAEDVRVFLDSEIERLQKLIADYKSDIKILGEDFNMDNPNGGMYSGTELTETHHEMEKHFLYAEEAKNDIYFYKKLKNAPYFGKVLFKTNENSGEKNVYIGLRTLQEHDTFKMMVCDWRAPVASLFYEEFDDKAFFDAPKGRIFCDLLLKRQFKFEDGELSYYVDSDLKIDDDILRNVLSSSSGEHLKVIVNSIQREQNKVIRYSDGENLLVCGPAGSGKTSVGFHRLAYLLYQNRKELSSAEIIMFSNNDIFASYVADIIPELGEMPINYASFYSIFAAEIPTVSVGDYYSLADDILNGNKRRFKSASFKMSEEFSKYLECTVKTLGAEFNDVKVYDRVIISKESLFERFSNDTENSQKIRGERLAAYTQGVIDKYFAEHRNELYEIADKDTDIDEGTPKILKRLRREVKSGAVEMIKNATVIDPVTTYFKFLKEYADKNAFPELLDSANTLKKGFVEFEDALCIVYMKTVLGTCAVLSGVKHILVDEAQDLSFVQHQIIRRMFPRAKVTLLADANQAIIPEINMTDTQKLSELYSAKVLNLNKSYRSTKQINKFALNLLNESSRYEIFERNGEDVDFRKGDSAKLGELLRDVSNKGKTLAVITKTASDAADIYSKLKSGNEHLRLCDNKSCEMGNAPVVMPLSLTKGLEFDSVIVVDSNGTFLKDENKKFLYLAATRALHKLTVFEKEQ